MSIVLAGGTACPPTVVEVGQAVPPAFRGTR